MDNITHTLVGMTLVRAGVGRRTPGAMAAMLLASNAPDLDIVSAITGGAVPYLATHRGPTHGVLGVIGLAIMSALIAWGAPALRRRALPPWRTLGTLAGIALAGSVLHVMMDLPTLYGVRLFFPFDLTWYALDWMPIVDVYVWALLGAGAIVAWVGPERRVQAARVVLAAILAFYGIRGVAQSRALAIAASTTADGTASPCANAPVLSRHPGLLEATAAGPGACLQAAALPTFFSPFTWQLVRQEANGYELRTVSLLDSDRPAIDRHWIPTESDAWVAAARRTTTGRVFLNFSRMPATRSVVQPDGSHRVRLVDVRFIGGPFQFNDEPEMRPPFVATVVVSPAGAILREGLGL